MKELDTYFGCCNVISHRLQVPTYAHHDATGEWLDSVATSFHTACKCQPVGTSIKISRLRSLQRHFTPLASANGVPKACMHEYASVATSFHTACKCQLRVRCRSRHQSQRLQRHFTPLASANTVGAGPCEPVAPSVATSFHTACKCQPLSGRRDRQPLTRCNVISHRLQVPT